MTDAGTPVRGRARGAPRWMLVALLALAGAQPRHRRLGGRRGVALPSRRRIWAGASSRPTCSATPARFPPSAAKRCGTPTAEERSHIRPFRREVRAAREETVKALDRRALRRQQFMAAQARQAEAENRARQAVQDLYIKIADGLTPEERHAFPGWREHRRPPGRNLLDEPDQQAGDPPPKR